MVITITYYQTSLDKSDIEVSSPIFALIVPQKENTAENQPSTPPEDKKYNPMDSDEDDEEPQNEPGTSSKSQTTVPLLPLQQGPAASSQGPAASSQGQAASAKDWG